jgi:hypothetical protein
MALTEVAITHVKLPAAKHRIAERLGVDPEELDDYFKHGEYFDLTLRVDEDLNVVGGQFERIKTRDEGR